MITQQTSGKWIFSTGILISLLGMAHQAALYLYVQESARLTAVYPEVASLLSDGALFSAGIGIVLILAGLLVCHSGKGVAKGEAWGRVEAFGVAILLTAAGLLAIVFQGLQAWIAYVHFTLALQLWLSLLLVKNEPMAMTRQERAA